jgi:hypothetical protein
MAESARRIRFLALAIVLGAAAGCVSKAALVPQSYAIDPPPLASGAPPARGTVLAVSRVDVAPPYAGLSFVYRTGDHGIERDPYASFAVSPGWMLSTAIRGYLRNAPFVRDVVTPGAGVPFAASIEAHATELYADLGASPAAVLTLQMRVLSSPAAGAPLRELLLKTYTERAPMGSRSAQAAADAWNAALAAIMKSFVADLQGALPPG